MSIEHCVITSHAQSRWNERRPNSDIRMAMASASRNTYHPMAVRAMASCGGLNANRYLLVTNKGEVFVVEDGGTKQILITVLVPEKTISAKQFDELDSMDEQGLRKAVEQLDHRQRDLKSMLKQLGGTREAVQTQLTLVKRRNKQRLNTKEN